MSTTARPSRLLVFAVFAGLFGIACDEQVREEFPLLEVNPPRVAFAGSQVGVQTRVPLELRNAGGSTLVVTELALSNSLDPNEFRIEHGALPFRLSADEVAIVDLFYVPADAGGDSGFLQITSNSSDGLETDVPITTTDLRAELRVEPPRLGFSSLDGAPVEETTVLTGQGGVPVRITDVFLADATDPEFELVTPVDALPTLERDQAFEITVRYSPTGGDTDVGDLIVLTDPPVVVFGSGEPPTDRIRIPLNAAQPSPEIEVSPEQINFGALDLGTESEIVEVIVENRGTAPLFIESIGLAPATPPPNNEQFRLHDLPDLAEPLVVPSEQSIRFGVSYLPEVDGSHATAIVIESNDDNEAVLTVPLSGRVRQPCIQVLPGSLDFGIVALNIESAPRNLQIANCGDIELTVDQIAIDDPDFQWAPADPMMGREDVVLPPLGAMPISVWYTNTALPERQRQTATLTVHNSTNETPEIEVPLVVTGGGAPTCELRILPRRMDFGLVARGRNVTRALNVINTGTGHCELTQQAVAPVIPLPPPFDQVPFILTGPAPLGRVGPGAEVPIEVTYRPQVFAADQALLRIAYDNPFTGDQNIEVTADLTGISGESNIEVIPGSLDFGRVTAGECASIEERVAVYNTGIVNLCITNMFLDGPDCDEFLIVDRPRADEDGCIIVTRNNPAEVIMVYEPTDLGPDTCNLVFESDANDTPELRVPLSGEGTRDRRQTDVFEQTSGRTVDVLFVVDNSGSMGEEQDSLQDNFADFINGAQQFANDYQLGIITTDMDQESHQGKLQGNPRIMRRGPGVEQDFRDTVEVGTNGAGEEKGLAAAQAALSDPLAFDTGVACLADVECVAPDTCIEGFCGGYNRGFLREDAALEIIFVSDEDDFSTASLNFYVDFFKNIKGFRNEGQFHAHAIVGVENGRARGCDGPGGAADAGSRYVEVANRTNGELFSICDDSFGPPLRELGNQAFGLPVQFFLSRPAIRNTVQVSVEGMRRNAGWQFDDPSNSVVFDEATVPQPGETIQVDYEAQCFERRGG